MRRPAKVLVSGAAYLDPLDCGSLVGYELHTRSRGGFSGTLTLTDCTRMITWYGSTAASKKQSLEKLYKAIGLFQQFRKAMAELKAARSKKCRK